MSNAIEVKNLCKNYTEFRLNDVSFSLPKGYIMGLVGKNGAGKTTTIQLMLNMLENDGGSIRVLGMDSKVDEISIKQDIAAIFDDVFFVDSWKVAEVEGALASFYKNWNHDTFMGLLHSFNLSKTKKVKELSRGMKMKLMLAVALSHEAKLLILDEPTSGLDPVARDELLDILMKYIDNEKCSILFSSHITSDLDKVADYITILNDGKVFYTGTKDALFETYCLVKGGLESLHSDIAKNFIGLKKYSSGFSALLKVSDMKGLPPDIVIEKVSIDDILVYINEEAQG